jgi:hypothetical protein
LPALGEGAASIGESISGGLGAAGQSISEGAGGIGETLGNFFSPLTNLFNQQPDLPPVRIGEITENFDSPLIPTEEERIRGNEFILNRISQLNQPTDTIAPIVVGEPVQARQSLEAVPIVQLEEDNASRVIQSEIPGQQFQGGQAGGGFAGGVVRETPIDRLSLSQIIDRFNVTASQAVDIRSRARDDFGDFDFGTNTGSGIGSVVSENPEISTLLSSDGAVSNPEFEGLSATEIARRLTGGVISNF